MTQTLFLTGRAEGTGVKAQSPRREGTAERTCQPGPISSAEVKGEGKRGGRGLGIVSGGCCAHRLPTVQDSDEPQSSHFLTSH